MLVYRYDEVRVMVPDAGMLLCCAWRVSSGPLGIRGMNGMGKGVKKRGEIRRNRFCNGCRCLHTLSAPSFPFLVLFVDSYILDAYLRGQKFKDR
jgi:hypothetical protein